MTIAVLVAVILVTSLSPGGSFASDPIRRSALEGSALDFDAGRMLGHAVLYALLGLALAVRFAASDVARQSPSRALGMIVLAIWILAAGTELAQAHVPGRAPELTDWLADMAGALIGLAVAGPLVRLLLRVRGG